MSSTETLMTRVQISETGNMFIVFKQERQAGVSSSLDF